MNGVGELAQRIWGSSYIGHVVHKNNDTLTLRDKIPKSWSLVGRWDIRHACYAGVLKWLNVDEVAISRRVLAPWLALEPLCNFN